jgi:hypothetical protein
LTHAFSVAGAQRVVGEDTKFFKQIVMSPPASHPSASARVSDSGCRKTSDLVERHEKSGRMVQIIIWPPELR